MPTERRRGAQADTKADAAAATKGRMVEVERTRAEEAVERAVRMARERASRAKARADASGTMAGVKRGAVEVVGGEARGHCGAGTRRWRPLRPQHDTVQ